ncbi:hypothetical protein EVAR_32827_1 [Eumeta japonica]|uniref:Uncharacterized protein n=1 Tax=Eumeta variegata TaxID=151549 RepID=A0A4C1WAL3_EUMVA|nr:hypothetical protein EVAR_32827_1 [Eumeta japonica]
MTHCHVLPEPSARARARNERIERHDWPKRSACDASISSTPSADVFLILRSLAISDVNVLALAKQLHISRDQYGIMALQAVTHPSTDHARRRLTSVIGREPVHSTWYGRDEEITIILKWSAAPRSPRPAVLHAEMRSRLLMFKGRMQRIGSFRLK